MINEALQHCPGIGPVRLAELHAAGVRTWQEAMDHPERIPGRWREALIEEVVRCFDALDNEDVQYFVNRLVPTDKWRILSHYLSQATFFDIETQGLNSDDPITVIICWQEGQFRIFVEHENLDEFLDLLDQVKLLISFNGNSFDVPRVLNAFHIPELPCAHLDLRWPSYHRGFSGGLKEIASAMGIERPPDLKDISGEHAVLLWRAWRTDKNQAAREHLIRYCAADVLLLVMVAHRLAGREQLSLDEVWSALPAVTNPPELLQQVPTPKRGVPLMLASGDLRRKRALLSRRWAESGCHKDVG